MQISVETKNFTNTLTTLLTHEEPQGMTAKPQTTIEHLVFRKGLFPVVSMDIYLR